jgi:hypothetical protein
LAAACPIRLIRSPKEAANEEKEKAQRRMREDFIKFAFIPDIENEKRRGQSPLELEEWLLSEGSLPLGGEMDFPKGSVQMEREWHLLRKEGFPF